MSKNLTRKGLALGTALAFVVTGLTATAPAFAAAGDVVSIAPTTGTGFGAYNTDYLNIDNSIDTDVVTSAAYDKLAIELNHSATAGGSTVTVKLNDGIEGAYVSAALCTPTLNIIKLNSLGAATVATVTATNVAVTGAADAAACQAGIDAAAAASVFTIPFDATFSKIALDLKSVTGSSALKLSLKAADAALTVHENESVSVTSWIDSDEDGKLEATDKFPSTTETATFYDAANVTVTPRVERFVSSAAAVNLNAAAADSLGVSLGFSPALNLDQVVLGGNFTFATTGGTDSAVAFSAALLSGNTSHSAGGRIYGTVDAATPTNFTLAASTAFSFSAIRANASAAGNTAVTSTTAGYTVPVQATAGVTAAAGALVDQTDESEQATLTTTAVKLRAGVKTFKYTMSSTAAADAVIANVPVIAYVKATGMATGSTVTVGTSVLKANQATLVSGVTDADGKFAVSVASSTASAGEGYSVVFYALLNNGTYSPTVTFAPAYEAGAATTMAQSSAILSGSTVEAKFSLKDQFGKAISAKSDGTAYTVRLQAPDTTKLKKYATFAAGAATVSFTNYLSKGQNDTITAAIGTGLDTAYADATVTTGDNLTATLYNPEDAAGVTTVASRTGNITYDDFITGSVSSTNVAPAAGSAVAHTGTVVDTSGVGIPGALVTISGKGLQFVKTADAATGDYAQDTITVSADAAGAFDVKIWAHQVSSTGIAVTTTAGGKTATTTLKTYLPSTLVNGNNLVFSWVLPAQLVKNTTYAVAAKLADKWGNPVATSARAAVYGVTFQGLGSVEVNSSTAAVSKNFDKTGQVTVFLRSVKDIAGPGSVEATLGVANYSATSTATATALAVDEISTNVTATKWDETAFKATLSANIEILEAAVATGVSSSVAGIKGFAAVTVRNASGKAVTVTVNGRVLTPRAPNSAAQLFRFRAGAGKTTVVVQVDGATIASRTVTVK